MKIHNLTEASEWISKNFNGNIVEVNKQMTKIIKQARENAKEDHCFLCGEKIDSFCNSHNIPAFCLRNINSNGMLLTANAIIKFPFYIKEETGINNAGTFHIICDNCDNTVFQQYENPNVYEKEPPHKVLAAIALKCSLKYIYKRKVEIEQYKIMYEISKNPHFAQTNTVNSLDLQDFLNDFKKAKKYINSNYTDGYFLFYYDLLEYTVPIAFQNQVALYVDFDGNIINDIYNKDPNYHLKDLFICVFPLKNKTAIMLFIDNKEKRYRKFYKQFNSLNREEKISVINYIIFLYSEDFYCSKNLIETLKNDKNVKEVTGKTTNFTVSFDDVMQGNIYQNIKKEYDLNKHKLFPNFLSPKYKIQETSK